MARFKRKWDCACCGKDLILDTVKRTLRCKCGTVKMTKKEIEKEKGSFVRCR